MPMLCYCVQIDLPVQLEIETLFEIFALGWLSRLDLSYSFPVGFPCVAPILFSVPRVALGISAGSRLGCVTSRGKPCWSTGLFAAGSAMLRLWHGLGLFRWLVSFGVKARVQQTGFQVVLAWRVMKGRSKSKRECNADAPHFLNCQILDPPTHSAGRIRVSVWGGAPPMSMGHTLVTLSCDEK